MTELLEHIAFITIAIAIYLPAQKAKFAFSGKNYTQTKYLIMVTYNFSIIYTHMNFLKTNHIPFYGHMGKYILGWLSLAMIFIHAAALPMAWKRRPWRLRKMFDPKIRKHKLTFDKNRLEHSRKSILLFWKR